MAIDTQIDRSQAIVFTRLTGKIGFEDWFSNQKQTWSDQGLFGFNELLDLSGADLSEISFQHLVSIADSASHLFTLAPNSRLAILISAATQQTMAEFFVVAQQSITGATRTVEIFESEEKARGWLSS